MIRQAEKEDIPVLLAIYNHEVVYGVATLDLQARTLEEWTLWFQAHNVDNHPLLVLEENGQVLGYVSLSEYRSKEAFQSTVELSLYIHHEHRGRGLATQLMEAILARARGDERTHLVVSVITAGNEASLALHKRFGFMYSGTLYQVGYKMGAYRDILHYSLQV